MKPELDRVKNDLETMQKALGMSTSLGRDWIQWMKRDQWLGLWWCLPGVILVVAALLPLDGAARYGGLVPGQWTGLLVSAVMLGLTVFLTRRVTADDGRPADFVRESKRVNGLDASGLWFGAAMVAVLGVYFWWGKQYAIGFQPLWSGLFMLMGALCLVGAVAAKAWPLLGWALPFLAYSVCVPLVEGHPQLGGVLLGLMFIAVALSFSFVSVMQIRLLERRHAAH
jgi:hypothetical protein